MQQSMIINFAIFHAPFFPRDLQYPDDELEKQQDKLLIRNVSSLPLNCFVELEHPFAMIDDQGNETATMVTTIYFCVHGNS